MGRDDEKDHAPSQDSPEVEDTSDGGTEQGRRRGRRGLRETARRLLEEPGAVREAKEALGAVIDTSDKAKTRSSVWSAARCAPTWRGWA